MYFTFTKLKLFNSFRVLIFLLCALFVNTQLHSQVILTQSFDAVTFPPVGWKNVKISGISLPGNFARVTVGASPTNMPHTGAGEARFNSFNYLAGTTGELSTSVLNFTASGSYTVAFWMYRDASAAAATDKIEVYVNTLQASAGGTLLGTIHRNITFTPVQASAGWYQYSFTAPGTYIGATNYFVFKAISGFGGNMYIDDITVTQNPPAAPSCISLFSPADGATAECLNETITWFSVATASAYKITMGSNAPDYNNIANNLDLGSSLSYTTPVLSASTVYKWKVVPYNAFGSAAGCLQKTLTTGLSVCYCTPTYLEASCLSDDFINYFSTTGGSVNITNDTSGCGAFANNYTFFSTKNVTAIQGNSITLAMQSGPDYPEGFSVWADWNHDGDFADATEFIYTSPSASLSAFNGNIVIPYTASLGTTRLRVRCQFNFPPTATDYCNGLVDGETEDYTISVLACTPTLWYADADADTYGNASISLSSCPQPPTYVANSSDCNDANNAIYPTAAEVCNGIDDNCSGTVDEGLIFTTYYQDNDADLYGSGISVNNCSGLPTGYAVLNGDCNDANSAIYPTATEVCNGIDDNCSGAVDEGLIFTTYYQDNDADTYGSGVSVNNCSGLPFGYAAINGDCNDANNAIYPSATEVCNGVDDNCIGGIDDGLTFITYYADTDLDGFGNVLSAQVTCNGAPSGYILNNTDCDDSKNYVYPGALEICDGFDNNCNGTIDEGVINTAISPTGATTVCTGVHVTYTAISGYTSYQWKRNGTALAGATGSSYVAKSTGNYTVTITSGICTATSIASGLVVSSPKPKITAVGSTNICLAGSVLLKGKIGAGSTFQWFKDGVVIAGASINLTVSVVGSYTLKETTSAGCSKFSPAVVVTSVCKLANITSTDAVISVYPNPAKNQFTLQFNHSEKVTQNVLISIYSATGIEVYRKNALLLNGKLNEMIVLENTIASGLYLVKLDCKDESFSKTLIIE